MEYEQTPEFHEAWKLKSRDMIAQAEWRRRKLGKRASLCSLPLSLRKTADTCVLKDAMCIKADL